MATPINNLVEILDHTDRAIANLLFQFKESDNIKSLVSVFTDELQLVEAEAIKILTLRILEIATGQQLDNIGEILKTPRRNANDEEYRIVLKIRNIRQTSEGTTEDILDILRLFTGDSEVNLYRGLKYFVDITYFGDCNTRARDVATIQSFFPVVTSLRIVLTSGIPFGFLGDAGAEGFGSIHDVTAGGSFVSLLHSTT